MEGLKMNSEKSRREWIVDAAAGAVGITSGLLEGCSKSKPEPSAQKEDARPAYGSSSSTIYIFCHGMMLFQLPKKTDSPKNKMWIRIPEIQGHIYYAGPGPTKDTLTQLNPSSQYTLTVNSAVPANSVPASIFDPTSYNLILPPSDPCDCDSTKVGMGTGSKATKEHCQITLTMPDGYEPHKFAKATNSDGQVFKYPNNCMISLSQIPLVQVFRYSNASLGTLIDSMGNKLWDSSMTVNKCHIFAAPATNANAGQMHLAMFDNFFYQPLDLMFDDPTKWMLLSEPTSGDITPNDLQDYQNFGPGSGLDGDPTTCMSGYGS
jgi:hypothetical protein